MSFRPADDKTRFIHLQKRMKNFLFCLKILQTVTANMDKEFFSSNFFAVHLPIKEKFFTSLLLFDSLKKKFQVLE